MKLKWKNDEIDLISLNGLFEIIRGVKGYNLYVKTSESCFRQVDINFTSNKEAKDYAQEFYNSNPLTENGWYDKEILY